MKASILFSPSNRPNSSKLDMTNPASCSLPWFWNQKLLYAQQPTILTERIKSVNNLKIYVRNKYTIQIRLILLTWGKYTCFRLLFSLMCVICMHALEPLNTYFYIPRKFLWNNFCGNPQWVLGVSIGEYLMVVCKGFSINKEPKILSESAV